MKSDLQGDFINHQSNGGLKCNSNGIFMDASRSGHSDRSNRITEFQTNSDDHVESCVTDVPAFKRRAKELWVVTRRSLSCFLLSGSRINVMAYSFTTAARADRLVMSGHTDLICK